MLQDHIILPGSSKSGAPIHECSKCGVKHQRNDGVEIRGKFVCGRCWRFDMVRTKKKAVK